MKRAIGEALVERMSSQMSGGRSYLGSRFLAHCRCSPNVSRMDGGMETDSKTAGIGEVEAGNRVPIQNLFRAELGQGHGICQSGGNRARPDFRMSGRTAKGAEKWPQAQGSKTARLTSDLRSKDDVVLIGSVSDAAQKGQQTAVLAGGSPILRSLKRASRVVSGVWVEL